LAQFLAFTSTHLNLYEDDVKDKSQEAPDWRIKEALILAIGSLAPYMVKYKELKQELEPIMMRYVVEELNGSEPLLRIRAAWMYTQLGGMVEFTDAQHVDSAS
jgi:hypothetical protein